MATDLIVSCNLSNDNDRLYREIMEVIVGEKAFLEKVINQISTFGPYHDEGLLTFMAGRDEVRAFLFPADSQHDHFLIILQIAAEISGSEVYRDNRILIEIEKLKQQIKSIDLQIDEFYRRLEMLTQKLEVVDCSKAVRKDFCRMTREYYVGFRINGSMIEVLLHHCRLARLVAHNMSQLVSLGVLPIGIDTRPIRAFFQRSAIKYLIIARFTDCWPYIGVQQNRYVLIVEKPAICEEGGEYQAILRTFFRDLI